MKVTTNPCFTTDKDLMIWQENNCLQCSKAVWYNAKLGRCPKYRCAVQKQMEAQAAGELEINERTYTITRDKQCSLFRSKDEEKSGAEILNFSQGESMVKATEATEEVSAPKIQASTSMPSASAKQEPHPDAALLKLAQETGSSYSALKDAERRMFETIASKAELPPVFHEDKFKKQIKDDVHTMLETFTWKENMMIAFVPLIISHIAFIYADRAVKYCADNRIPETVKLSRAVKHVKQEYLNSLKQDLDARHIERINEQTEMFCEEYSYDFTILWFSVNGEYKRRFKDSSLNNMRTDAYISILMCRFLVEHNKRMDKIIEAKMGFAQSIKNPYLDKLETCMDAYCGNDVIENTKNINACMTIFKHNLDKIEFDVDDSEPK